MFKTIFSNFFSNTPQAHKEMRNLAITAVIISGSVLALPATVGIAIPAIILTGAKTVITIAAALGINAQSHKEA